MQFQLLKVKTQSVWVCWICTTFIYNQIQFGRVEVPCLGHHLVYPNLTAPSYRKNDISLKSNYKLTLN